MICYNYWALFPLSQRIRVANPLSFKSVIFVFFKFNNTLEKWTLDLDSIPESLNQVEVLHFWK